MENIDAADPYLAPQTNAPLTPAVPSPNSPPWTSPAAVGYWFFSIVLMIFVPAFLLIPYLMSIDGGLQRPDLAEFAKKDPTALMIQVGAIIPVHILTLAAGWLLVTKVRKYKFTEMLGWRSPNVTWLHYLVILAGILAMVIVVGNFFPNEENDMTAILKSSLAASIIVAILATFTAPIVEEVIYRGVLYSALQRTFGVPAAIALVTLAFALVHVPQYYPSYSTIGLLTVLSLVLTLLRVYSRNLLPSIILHTLFNGFQSVLILLTAFSREPETPVSSFIIHLFK